MPDLTAHAATFRAGNHRFTGYLGVLPYTSVLDGTVSATPTFPALTVSYTNVSGDHDDGRENMLVEFYDSGGNFKGQTRVATGGSITNVSLPIAETSQGVVNIANGDTVVVRDVYLMQDKLVSATKALNKDSRIVVSDNTSNPPPVANAGGAWFGFVDSGETFATVTFDSDSSFRVDPDAGTLTRLWDVVDG